MTTPDNRDPQPRAPSPEPRERGEQDEALAGWARICFDEVGDLFDAAHEGLGPFIERELRPLDAQLARSANLRLLGDDLVEVGLFLFARDKAARPELVLPSERRMARAFARWCVGPESLELYLQRTFDFVADAVARRCGADLATELVLEALRDFEPVHREAMRRLAAGPRLLRVTAGPGRYLTAPVLWSGAWAINGAARRRSAVRAVLHEVAQETGRASYHPGLGQRIGRAVGLAGLGVLGAGITSVVVHRALDVEALYTNLLDEVEALLLYGSVSDEPGEHSYGVGLVDLMIRLEVSSQGR